MLFKSSSTLALFKAYFLAAVILLIVLNSCTVPRKYQANKPFLFSTNIAINDSTLSRKEKKDLRSKLFSQLDDSSKVKIKDLAFVFHFINRPPAYDSAYSGISAGNMRAALVHSGYYGANVSYKADTVIKGTQQRVRVMYTATPGKATLIDSLNYNFSNADIQKIVNENHEDAFLSLHKPITKADILSENSRLIDLLRNNGYYKFTEDNIYVVGDTTIELLTNVSDDPFENLRLLALAKEKRKKPTIKIAYTLNPNVDSSTLRKYHINNINIFPDYGEFDTSGLGSYTLEKFRNLNIYYKKKLFKSTFLGRNVSFRKGNIYRQTDYVRTINNFSKMGVWQIVNVTLQENKDSLDKLDVNIQLVPAKKYGFEANIESSYSTNNTYTTGNLLGFSGNLSLQNRNLAKEAIKMTHAIRTGVELNVSKNKSTSGVINSTDLGYTNTIAIPRLIAPIKKMRNRRLLSQQTFLNTNISYTNRLNLFKLQSYSFAFGYDWRTRSNRSYILKPLNLEYSYLYNRSDSFISTLDKNPYLKYSFNTALVMGSTFGYTSFHYNAKSKWQRDFKLNIEESGLLWGRLGIFKQTLRQFIKTDGELTWTRNYKKSSHVFRLFGGVGIPLTNKDSSLPFFKQYFAGGANSMRGWPVRGIGQGARPLPAYGTTTFNDRTGDVRLEANYEYRYTIATIIPNTFVLKGALFVDAGNIWNFKNTRYDGKPDSLQFQIANVYKQLGVTGGTGFRLDFNYFLIRFDLGFRFKKPDIKESNGWQFPSITFNRLFKRGEMVPNTATPDPNDKINDERYKKWRYDNFNFTIGISYPF